MQDKGPAMAMAEGSSSSANKAPRHESQPQPPRVVFHLTGFGVFNGVADNPTSHLMRELPGELETRPYISAEGIEVRSYDVLEVSAHEGGRRLLELFGRAGGDGGNRLGQDVGSGGATMTTTVFVHCGVNAGAKEFALETQGVNEATFEAPDNRGYCPTMAPVDEDNPDTTHRRVTTVPVPRVLERLRGMGWGKDLLRDSRDAGRFVCNYVYYTSLGLCEELTAPGEAYEHLPASGGLHSLFLHVPPFEMIPKERQLAFLADCLSATAAELGAVGGSSADGATGDPRAVAVPEDNGSLPLPEPPRLDQPGARGVQQATPAHGEKRGGSPSTADGGGRGGEEQLQSAAAFTRQRLVETGFEELDVDAAMATTGSDRLEVNMQFLMEMAPLLPPGAPTERASLNLDELCHDATGARPPPVCVGKPRTKGAISPGLMGGVSPKWARGVSPVDRAAGDGVAYGGNNSGSGNGSAGTDHSENNPARGKKGGLLSRIRRHHRRVSSTASENAVEDMAGRDLPLMSRWLSSPATTRGVSAENEYSRQTTGKHSNSPIRSHPGSGFERRVDPSAGWGETLPTGSNLRLVLLVRLDLAMGPGAIAAHCSKATLAAVRKAESGGGGNALDVWREAGEAIVVLGVANVQGLDAVLEVSYRLDFLARRGGGGGEEGACLTFC